MSSFFYAVDLSVKKKEKQKQSVNEGTSWYSGLRVDHDQGSELVDGLKLSAKLLPHKILLAHISTHMYVKVFKF